MVEEEGCKGSWEAVINIGSCIFFHLCCTKMRRRAMIISLEIGHKSGKSQGILKWKLSGNPEIIFQ